MSAFLFFNLNRLLIFWGKIDFYLKENKIKTQI